MIQEVCDLCKVNPPNRHSVMKLYAVRDTSTGKLVNNITNPKHKFWEKRGNAEKAIQNYNPLYTRHNRFGAGLPNKTDLQLVEFELIERLNEH